jgi:lipopolysaccharide export LptBFGC system permease protein LptF
MKMGAMDFQGEGLNMHLGELAAQIRKGKKENRDTRQWEVEFHKKFSIPFSALAFALIGMPLGLLSKTGSLMSPVLAVVLVVVYNLFMMYGEVGGPMGTISPFLAMWLPNVVLSVLGFWLIYHLNHKFWKVGFGTRFKKQGDDPHSPVLPAGK